MIKVAAKTSAGVGVFGNITASISLCKFSTSHFLYNTFLLTVDVNASSTAIWVIWDQVENDVLITWNRTSSQCTDKSESFKNHSLSNCTSYEIPDLKKFTEYNITVCINGSTCNSRAVTTNEAGMFIIL